MVSKQTMPPAVILAGGEGKRLRPLTTTTPKPLLPMLGQPLLFHILQRLERMGVEKAYVMTGYLGEKIEKELQGYKGNLKTVCIHEKNPMGSAGCLTLIPEIASLAECLVVSGDAYFEFDLREAVAFRRQKDAAAVLCLARVDSPTAFGIVETAEDGRILGFTEKPTWSRVKGDLVNTGIYVLGKKTLRLLSRKILPLDFGADVFPELLRGNADLFGRVGQGFWCDVGTPKSYLRCNLRLSNGQSVLGKGTKLASDCTIVESVLFDGVQIGSGAKVEHCVIGENTTVSEGVCMEEGAVVGACCVIGDYCRLGAGVTLPAGTIVAARSVLLADFNMETEGYFENGYLILRPRNRFRCGARVGRVFAACTGKGQSIALMQDDRRGHSEFFKGLCEGILAYEVNIADCFSGFAAEAAFAALCGIGKYALYVEERSDEIKIGIFDENGLYPDARFERHFSDFAGELPAHPEKEGALFTVKDLRERYRNALCLACADMGNLKGITVKVYENGSFSDSLLEKALIKQGATVAEHADICLIPHRSGMRTEAVVCGMHVDWWQIVTVLALEQVKKTGCVFLPYQCPESIKKKVNAAGGRAVYFTMYPENGSEQKIREILLKQQPWILDGLFAAMCFVSAVGRGDLHAGELAEICQSTVVSEEPFEAADPQGKMRMICAHSRDFDGEGLLRRYREGCVRVVPGRGGHMHLMAEAADSADAAELIRKVKKEILGKDV